jgi:hypothetical protein
VGAPAEAAEVKAALFIMHAREIPECLQAFRALKGVDKVWFRGYTELQLEAPMNAWVSLTDYDYYIMSSDDLIPTQSSLDAILRNLDAGPVVTGWSRMDPNSEKVNVRLKHARLMHYFYLGAHALNKAGPVANDRISKGFLNSLKDFTLSEAKDITNQPDVFPVYFVGFSFTAISRQTWLDYPFQTYRGRAWWVPRAGSDFSLSERLLKGKVPMQAVRDAEVLHLLSRAKFIVGKVEPKVIVERET